MNVTADTFECRLALENLEAAIEGGHAAEIRAARATLVTTRQAARKAAREKCTPSGAAVALETF